MTAEPVQGQGRLALTRGGGACAALLAVGVVAVFAREQLGSGPLLPVSLCRWSGGAALAPFTPARLVTAWQLDGVALSVLAIVGLAYARAVQVVGRAHPAGRWPRIRSASFAAGLGVIALVTCGGIGVYDMTQFWIHMVQHLALIMVAPPLLTAGRPLTLALHATRNPWHTRIKRALRSAPVTGLTSPPVALALYAVTIVGTHLTGIMNQVMQRPWLGQAEHLLYVVTGFIFFTLLFGDAPIRWRLAMPARLLLILTSMVVDTFVGIALLSTNTPFDMTPHAGWGLGPLADTQAGGGIMWVFGDALMVVLTIVLFGGWARRPEHARLQSRSWLEQARRQTLLSHTETTVSAPVTTGSGTNPAFSADLDEDEASYHAYNDWLARLAERPGPTRP